MADEIKYRVFDDIWYYLNIKKDKTSAKNFPSKIKEYEHDMTTKTSFQQFDFELDFPLCPLVNLRHETVYKHTWCIYLQELIHILV